MCCLKKGTAFALGQWKTDHLLFSILVHFKIKFHSEPHSPTLPSLHLRHSSFPNASVASPKSQFILQSFCRFTYVTIHSPALPSFHLQRRIYGGGRTGPNPLQKAKINKIKNRKNKKQYLDASSLTANAMPATYP